MFEYGVSSNWLKECVQTMLLWYFDEFDQIPRPGSDVNCSIGGFA